MTCRAWGNLGVVCLKANDEAGAMDAATNLRTIGAAVAQRLEKSITSRDAANGSNGGD